MMELADMQDLGAVTSEKVFHFVTRIKIKYADMAKLVYAIGLGAVTSVKVFRPRCHCEPDRLSGVAIRSLKTGIACFYKSWIRLNAPPRIPLRVKIRGTKEYAGMMELADMQDLGAVTLVKVFSVPLDFPRTIL